MNSTKYIYNIYILLKCINKYIEKIGSFIFFEKYFYEKRIHKIQKFAANTNTILELGVGKNSYFHKKQRKYKITGLDIYKENLFLAKTNGIIDDFIIGDVRQINTLIGDNSYDLVCAFDLIEHLSKNEGEKLINEMIRIAKKRIIIYTPNGFQYQPPTNENPFQEHLSGWEYSEMKNLGFSVIGLNGFIYLKGMYALPRYRPYFLFSFLSNISELFLRFVKRNDLQYSILCVKDIK